MTFDERLTIRIPVGLKEEIEEISAANGLTLSKGAIQLLAKAIAQYREDGVLIDKRNRSVLREADRQGVQEVRAEKRQTG